MVNTSNNAEPSVRFGNKITIFFIYLKPGGNFNRMAGRQDIL